MFCMAAGPALPLTAGVRPGKSARGRHTKRDHNGEAREHAAGEVREARGERASGACHRCVRRSGRHS
jgi:hypothetical protein